MEQTTIKVKYPRKDAGYTHGIPTICFTDGQWYIED